MQRFRLEEARFEMAKTIWLERWTNKIRDGVDEKTGARLDKLMGYLPLRGWGAYWVRQQGWFNEDWLPETGWGESWPRSWNKLYKKPREARARVFASRGLMDIPPDIKGVLLMERVVKWWTAKNFKGPREISNGVLRALDDLATEVGLVDEYEISTLVKRLDRLMSEVEESQVVIRHPDPSQRVADPPANKNTQTWWDFDHELAKAARSLATGTVWLGEQPSGLTTTMATKAKQLETLKGAQLEATDKMARFWSKCGLDLDMFEAVDKMAAAVLQVQNSLKSKPRTKGRIKKTYNKALLGLDSSAESVEARKTKTPLPCWYHHREGNWEFARRHECRRKHRSLPVRWDTGCIYGRP
ncbi:hypothetical protein QBC39DRAFT_346172 [Podospora conica]|nr:hypothetical protein QBC39DRAFT_346172 [Schizothecium conicum]